MKHDLQSIANRVVAMIVIFIAACALVALTRDWQQRRELDADRAAIAIGSIDAINRHVFVATKSGKSLNVVTLRYRFAVGQSEYFGSSECSDCGAILADLKVGDEIQIRYSTRDPRVRAIDLAPFLPDTQPDKVLMGICLCVIAFGCYFFWMGRQSADPGSAH